MTDNILYEQLQALQKAESETLVRELAIDLLEPETSKSKAGHAITFLVWRYRNPASESGDWQTRKSPIFTDEAKLLINHGPYEKGALYRVTARKNQRGYWQWTAIEQVTDNTPNTNS
ncbi:MAG: hypothetical protein AB2551_10970 [Candidatus Thiodiazotropha sp.]